MSGTQLYNLARMRALAADIETERNGLKRCMDQLLDIKDYAAVAWEDESSIQFQSQFENLLDEMRTVYTEYLPDRVTRVTEQVDAVEKVTSGPI